MKNFIRETGAILSSSKDILHWVVGSSTSVTFPAGLIWRLHTRWPGIVWGLTHIHPPGLMEMSHDDETMFKAWVIAFSPFPIRFIIVTELPNGQFTEITFLGQLESKEDWIKRGKKGARELTIEVESKKEVNPEKGYLNLLRRKSYA